MKRNSQIHQGNENILEAEKEAESKIARDEFELEKNEEMKADEENIATEKESKNMNDDKESPTEDNIVMGGARNSQSNYLNMILPETRSLLFSPLHSV